MVINFQINLLIKDRWRIETAKNTTPGGFTHKHTLFLTRIVNRTMNSKVCYLLCRDILIAISLATMLLSISCLYCDKSLQKSDATTDSGLHLLSCPKLFQNGESDSYLDLQLSSTSQDKLLKAIEESHQASHMYHTNKRFKSELPSDFGDEIDIEHGFDVNVPAFTDNKNLCDVLQAIIAEQADVADSDSSDGVTVSVSILKLQPDRRENPLLRGVDAVKKSLSRLLVRVGKVKTDASDPTTATENIFDSNPEAIES